ncbi:acrosomal protein SP-10 isoform X4 [Carlito syrichta]|uniref:Acrosomal protein SP-10 isoform X4 n=1 Tax=Carlito syrichta TaxID=1868482 RepID=A0A1U7UBF9_CARSF|nr:acrosomal protein SP-10 isoform X4 [Carlito syrichta]
MKFLLLISLSLLGSAGGASGQPDEPSGSIDHQASVQQLPGEHTSSEQPSGEHASSEQPVAEHTLGEHASSEQPVGEHVSSDQPSGEHVSGEQPSGEHAAGEQPSDAPLSSTSLGAMLNCHTCAYMNNQGQCLRGEGICTTQKSQQCMLKKIFEGGKLQFMVQGCENMCPSMNLFSHGTRMQIICCRNQSFCNKI